MYNAYDYASEPKIKKLIKRKEQEAKMLIKTVKENSKVYSDQKTNSSSIDFINERSPGFQQIFEQPYEDPFSTTSIRGFKSIIVKKAKYKYTYDNWLLKYRLTK